MSHLRSAVLFVTRTLGREPGFSLVVVSILALAIAGNATMFSLVDAALLEPLPYGEPGRLVTVDVLSTKGYYISTSVPNYRDWRDRSRTFERWGASAGWDLTLTGRGQAEILQGRAVFGDFFEVLGLEAVRGRVIRSRETEPGTEPLVVLGHEAWQTRFGGDSEILDRTLVLDGRPHLVVGILEPGSGYPSPDTEIYFPMGSLTGLPWDDRTSSFGARAVARLRPEVTPEQAQQDLDRIHREIVELEGQPVDAPEVRTLDDLFVGSSRSRLWLLFGAVGLVLAIALANVINLFLVRNESRSGALAVRRALGANRWQLVRPILGEGLVFALAGGAAGLALTASLARFAMPWIAGGLPGWIVDRAGVDWKVALFTLALSAVVGIVAGIVPALLSEFSRDLSTILQEGAGRGATRGRARVRSALLVIQVAVAVVLLVGASLLLGSLQKLRAVDLGFDPEGVLAARVEPPRGTGDDPAGWLGFYSEVEERVRRLPGVDTAAVSLLVPLGDRNWEMIVHTEGRDPSDFETGESVLFGIASEGYFETLGIPLLQGRAFRSSDRMGAPPVAIVDETMAEMFWPGENPLGKRITVQEWTDDHEPVYRTVVGVAENVHHYSVGEPSRIQVYFPLRQPRHLHDGGFSSPSLSVLARTSLPVDSLVEPLRSVVAEIEPDAAVHQVASLQHLVDEALAPNRAVGTLLVAFAGLALLLAALGVFGLLSWFVVQRLREIGIRMALGADGQRVTTWVSSRALGLTGIGILLGFLAAAALSRLLERYLFGVEPLALGYYLTPASILLVAALLASLIPALRAVRADPARVLRE